MDERDDRPSLGMRRRERPGPATSSAPRIVGGFVRALREAQRLTQRDAAEISRGQPWEISKSTISSIERGRSLPSLEALVAISRVLHIDPSEIVNRVDRALDQHPPRPPKLTREDQLKRADELFWSGRYREAAALYDLLLAGLPAHDDPYSEETTRWRATYEIRRASSLRRCGALLAARSAAERVVALAAGHPDLQAEGYIVLSASYRQLNNGPLALDAANRATDLADECDDRLRGRAWLQKGACLFHFSRYAEARSAFLRARHMIHRTQDHSHTSHVEGNIGMCWLHLGRADRARLWIGRAMELARRHSLPMLEASWLVELGRVELEEGRLTEAESCARAAIRVAKPREHWLTLFRAEWLLHLIEKRRQPDQPDRHRLAYLTRLLRHLAWHAGDPTVREFKELVLGIGRESQRKPS